MRAEVNFVDSRSVSGGVVIWVDSVLRWLGACMPADRLKCAVPLPASFNQEESVPMFETIQSAPPDAILGLSTAFKADPNPDKVNLTVGVYQDAQGNTPVLDCVKRAEERLLDAETSKTYLPIDGIAEFCRSTQSLYFGDDHDVIAEQRVVTVQTPGGTGALRVGADFLKTNVGTERIWCSAPTWPNHPKVFQAAGLSVQTYPYYDASRHGVDLDAMKNAIQAIPGGDVICLHACCHNPTGADPTADEWRLIADWVYAQGLIPLIDFAYLGFGGGIDADTTSLKEFARPGAELLVSSSYSKNFGLYRERVGALTVVTGSSEATDKVGSQLKATIRANYSNPPSHGALIVGEILRDSELRTAWETELTAMRERIRSMRALFTASMARLVPDRDFSFIEKQVGMFSYTGLNAEQADRLREDFSVYIVRDGRVNIAGISPDNVDTVCRAIAAVLSES